MHAVWIWSALLVLAFWRVDATPGSEAYSVIFDPRVNFNATGGVGSFAKRGVFGSSLAALFAEVTRFQMTVLKGLLASCAPDQPLEDDPRLVGPLVRRPSRCPEVFCVDVEPFGLALLRAHAGLHRCALGLLAKLPRSAAAHEMRFFLEVLRRRSKSLTFSEKCARVVNLFLARDAEFAPAKGFECVDMKPHAIACMMDSITELRLLSAVMEITQARAGEMLRESASGLQVDLPVMAWNPFLGLSRADILSNSITLLAGASDTPAIVRVAELGVNKGLTSEHLLRAHSNLQMYLVDPYHLAGGQAGDDVAHRLREAIDRTQPFRDRATFILQESARAASLFCPGSLDIVFVDGDHSYEAALADLRLWWPLLRSGGRLMGHDYGSVGYPGVVRAVHEFARDTKLPLHLSPDAVFMFQKE